MILGTNFLNTKCFFIQKEIYGHPIPAANDKCYKKYAMNADIRLFRPVYKKKKFYLDNTSNIADLSASVLRYNMRKFLFPSFCVAFNAFTGNNRKNIIGLNSQNKLLRF